MIHPLSLACLPTPLHPLRRASARLGVEIWIKRDDLTGAALSGNKVRKLDFLMADALASGATSVITTGAVTSNHARATAIAGRQLGLQPVLMLRGQPPAVAEGNLLLDALVGSEIHYVTPEDYVHREARMAALADARRATGDRPYIIPEGGSNAIGALGYVRAARELSTQALAEGLRFDVAFCAVGSGGTLAGLAMGGLAGTSVLGVAVCDDKTTFSARVLAIAAEAGERWGLGLTDGWEVVEGFQGRGYGLSRPEELAELRLLAREEGILLDPVYTGKAWFALANLARDGKLGKRVLFWHTGGLLGLFGRGAELLDATPDPRSAPGGS